RPRRLTLPRPPGNARSPRTHVVRWGTGGRRPAAKPRVTALPGAARALRRWRIRRADPQTLPDGGGLLNDPVDGRGVHDGRVHGRAVDVVESHDFEAQRPLPSSGHPPEGELLDGWPAG